jgi:hypothetical protein
MNLELARLRLFVGATVVVAINSGCGGVASINPNETGGTANGGAANLGGANAGGTGGSDTGGTSSGSVALDAAIVGSGCPTTTWPVSLDSPVFDVPTGPKVTAMIGAGSAPTPNGGVVTPGSYWLVAETIYGYVPPSNYNYSSGVPGQTLCSEIAVTGDRYAQAFQQSDAPGGSLATNVPLDPQAYAATSSTLSLITVTPYGNLGVTLGTYTVVDDYVLVSNGVAQGTAPQRVTGSASTVLSKPRDPRCPTTVPDAGTACDPSAGPIECEYGGDTLGRCTQSTACALQTDGSYRFQSYPSMGCDPNPANCPASFGAADATAGVIADAGYCEPRDEFLCNYPEGVCNCGSVSTSMACGCITPGYLGEIPWQQPGPCPNQRPLSGDGCSLEGLWCIYAGACSRGFSLGPSMACMGGYWERLDENHSCPATTLCP